MSGYSELKSAINRVIRTNNNREITGQILQNTLNSMVNSLGANYQFAGFASPTMEPGTPDQNVFYIANEPGLYTNFGNIELSNGLSFLMWKNNEWTSNTLSISEITEEWVDNNFISKDYFRQIFRTYDENGEEIFANDTTSIIDNIKAMCGLWTEQYLSALGLGRDGGSTIQTLAQLEDVQLNMPANGDVLAYNFAAHKWENKQIQTGVDMSVVWDALAANTNEQINISHLNTALSGYVTTAALETALQNYASQSWVNQNFITVEWFDKLFHLYNGAEAVSNKIAPNGALPVDQTQLNIEAMFGFWTKKYISALGQGDDGSVGSGDVTWALLADGIDTRQIALSHLTNVISTLTGYTTSGKNYAVQKDANNHLYVNVPWSDTTYAVATQSITGLMSATDKTKLDGIAANANNYSLPLATSGTRGGVKVGYSETNSGTSTDRNYAVQLSSEKMYVNVPWVNTWRGIQNNLTSQSTTDSLSAYQGYMLANGSARDSSKLPLTGGTLIGTLTTRDVVVQSNYSLKIGNVYLTYDSTNNAIRVSANADGTGVANFYAIGGVSALGQSNDGSAGSGDVTWALLADNTDNRQIALSHLSTGLTTLTGYTTSGKNYAVQKDANNHLYVNVPWEAGSGTVTSIKVGTTTYSPSSGVVSLPAYPTTLPASDVYSWAKAENKPVYTYSEVGAASSTHTHTTNITTSSGTNQLTLAFGTKYAITAGDTSYVFTMPSNPNTNTTYKFTIGSTTKGDATNGVDLGTLKSETAAASGTTLSLVTTGEKAIWNAKSNLAIGTTATTAAAGNHTHPLSIAADSGTNQFSLAHNTKYKLTAGGSTLIFTTPVDSNSWRNIYTGGTSQIGTGTNTKAMNFVGVNGIAVSFFAAGTGAGQSGNANYFSIKLDGSHTHATSIAADSGTNQLTLAFGTKYKLTAGGTSYIFTMPANPNTDHYDWLDITNKPLTLTKNTTGFSISGGNTSKTLTVSESYSLGAACAKGVTDNSTNADVTSSDTNLITGRTLYYQLAKKGYTTNTGTVTSVATGTGLTGGTITTSGTISINSTYQTYISHGESAYNSLGNYLPLSGGTLTGKLSITTNPTEWLFDGYTNNAAIFLAHRDGYGVAIHSKSNNSGKYLLDIKYAQTSLGSGGTTAFYVKDNGLVGIGTDTPSYALDVRGVACSKYLLFYDLSYNSVAGYIGRGSESSNNIQLIGYQNNSLVLGANSQDVVLINTSLNVGIGTSSPLEKLDVNGNIKTSTTNGSYIQVGAIRLMYDSTNNALKVIKSDGTNANLYATGGVSALGAGQESGGSGDVTWALLADNTDTRQIAKSHLTTALSSCMPSSGGVMYSDNHSEWSFDVQSSYASTLTTAKFAHREGYGMFIGVSKTSSTYIMNLTSGITALDGAGAISRFYVGSNGNVGIGTESPSYKLHVAGAVGATGFTNTSDIRKKNRIKGVELRLDQIAKAPAFEYYWLDPSIDHDLHVGTSAQYWESVLPQVVTTAKDEIGTKSLQYGVAALISAITVARKVVKHEEEIALLKKHVLALEKENGEQANFIATLQEELSKFKAA